MATTDAEFTEALLRAFDFKSNGDANGAASEQLRITRLPFTRFEAEGILKAAPSPAPYARSVFCR